MKRRDFYSVYWATGAILCLSLFLAGCTQPISPTQVAILFSNYLTDEFEEINLKVTKIEAFSTKSRGVTLVNGERSLNLLNLPDTSAEIGLNDLPQLKYKKLRLSLKEKHPLELVKKNHAGEVIETLYPPISGFRFIDLLHGGEFEIIQGETLVIELDVDAEKSIKVSKRFL